MSTIKKKGGRPVKISIADIEAKESKVIDDQANNVDIIDHSEINNLETPDPFTGSALKERDYTKARAKVVGGDLPLEVGEPDEAIPTLNLDPNAYDENGIEIEKPAEFGGENGGRQLSQDDEMLGGKTYDQVKQEPTRQSSDNSGGGGSKQPKQEPLNPEFDGMTNKEKKESAQFLTDTVMEGYKALHMVGNHVFGSNIERFQKKSLKGEFDLTVLSQKMQYDADGNVKAVGAIIEDADNVVKETMVVSAEFEAEVRPLLTQVLSKKGLGMSPETRLGIAFATDAGMKLFTLLQHKSLMNDIVDIAKNNAIQERKLIAPTPPQPTPQPQQQRTEPINKPSGGLKAEVISTPEKGKRGRPKKVQLEQDEVGE